MHEYRLEKFYVQQVVRFVNNMPLPQYVIVKRQSRLLLVDDGCPLVSAAVEAERRRFDREF